MNSSHTIELDKFSVYAISNSHMEPFMQKMILIDSGAYGKKLAIPYSEIVLNAIMSAKSVNCEYDSNISGHHLYIEDRKVEVTIVNSADLETPPIKPEQEIKQIEEEREKLLKLVDEMNAKISQKLNG